MSGATALRLGALSAAVSVAAGAFGAHGLRGRIGEPMLAIFETAARYQMYHALGLLAVGLLALQLPPPRRVLALSGWSFLVGTLLFSGSLYALALTGERRLGAITPFGGAAFLVGWLAMAFGPIVPAGARAGRSDST